MKKFLSIALGIFLTAAEVSAEQPKAQEYREILASENFYVEYEDKNVKRIIAQENGRRMERADLSGAYKAAVSILNPLAPIFDSSTKFPDFMYHDGKYYKFLEKDYALMADENQLDDENLNPSEGWSLIHQHLSLPDELAVLNWNDPQHKVSPAIAEPVFATTITRKINGRDYTCDRYESIVKTATGAKEATIVFDLCYNGKGDLELAQSAIFANGKEYGINRLTIKKIQREIPKGAIVLDKGAKVFSAGIGDMNDLLENPPLIGKLKDLQGW